MNLETNRKEKWRKKSKLNGWEKKEVMNLETNRKEKWRKKSKLNGWEKKENELRDK